MDKYRDSSVTGYGRFGSATEKQIEWSGRKKKQQQQHRHTQQRARRPYPIVCCRHRRDTYIHTYLPFESFGAAVRYRLKFNLLHAINIMLCNIISRMNLLWQYEYYTKWPGIIILLFFVLFVFWLHWIVRTILLTRLHNRIPLLRCCWAYLYASADVCLRASSTDWQHLYW